MDSLPDDDDPMAAWQCGLCLDCNYGFGGETGYGTGIAVAMHNMQHPGHRIVVTVGENPEWGDGGTIADYVRLRWTRRLTDRIKALHG